VRSTWTDSTPKLEQLNVSTRSIAAGVTLVHTPVEALCAGVATGTGIVVLVTVVGVTVTFKGTVMVWANAVVVNTIRNADLMLNLHSFGVGFNLPDAHVFIRELLRLVFLTLLPLGRLAADQMQGFKPS
jgi:hypothetical protein